MQTSRLASQRLFIPSARKKVYALCAPEYRDRVAPEWYVEHDDRSGVPASGFVELLRGSEEQM